MCLPQEHIETMLSFKIVHLDSLHLFAQRRATNEFFVQDIPLEMLRNYVHFVQDILKEMLINYVPWCTANKLIIRDFATFISM